MEVRGRRSWPRRVRGTGSVLRHRFFLRRTCRKIACSTVLGATENATRPRGRSKPGQEIKMPEAKKSGHIAVDVLGDSFGSGVAFQLALQHPDKVRRLVLVSAGFATNGFYPEMLPQQAQVGAAMAEFTKETPMYKSYMAVAPKPEDFPRLLD